MNTEPKWSEVKSRLVLLYKIINQLTLAAEHPGSFGGGKPWDRHDFERCKNLVATLGLNLIVLNHRDERPILTRDASKGVQPASVFIADEFYKISLEMEAVSGMNEQLYADILDSGMDKIIDVLKTRLK